MKALLSSLAVLLLTTAGATQAGAQQSAGGEEVPPPPSPTKAVSGLAEGAAFDLAAGAGVADFTRSLGDHTHAGFGWSVRAGYNVSQNVGLELGYIGATNSIEDSRLTSSHSVVTNGANADLKLMAPLKIGAEKNSMVRPYIFGGAGGSYFGVTGDNPPQWSGDSSIQLPVGGGTDIIAKAGKGEEAINIGARFDYLIGLSNRVSTDFKGDQFSVTGTVGIHY